MSLKTIGNYGGALQQFELFDADLPVILLPYPLGFRIVAWIESKRQMHEGRGTTYGASAQAQDLKNVRAAYTKIGVLSEEDRMILGAAYSDLVKNGALVSDHQAPPIAQHQLLALVDQLPIATAVTLLVAWKTASRFEDIAQLKVSSFSTWEEMVKTLTGVPATSTPRPEWFVTWVASPKNPYRSDTVPLHLNESQTQLLSTWLMCRKTQGPDVPFSPLTPSAFDRALKLSHPDFSMHSVKRGALLHLLMSGASFDQLKILAKHQELITLLRYLPKALVAHRLLGDLTSTL